MQISDWTGRGCGTILPSGGPDVLPIAPLHRARSEHGPVQQESFWFTDEAAFSAAFKLV